MGQKVHPTGVRVGIIKDWNAKWYADSKNFADYLIEDQKIRKFLKKKLYTAGISKIEIERTAKAVKVNLYAAKPGIVIGKGGAGAESVKADLAKEIGKEVTRGSTGIFGKGMYTNEDKLILMCAVSRKDIAKVKIIAKKIDPKSFIIITNSREVVGQGFKRS